MGSQRIVFRGNLKSTISFCQGLWLPDLGRQMGQRFESIPEGIQIRGLIEGSQGGAGRERATCKPEGVGAETGTSVKRPTKQWRLNRLASPTLLKASLPTSASLRAYKLQTALCCCFPCLHQSALGVWRPLLSLVQKPPHSA